MIFKEEVNPLPQLAWLLVTSMEICYFALRSATQYFDRFIY